MNPLGIFPNKTQKAIHFIGIGGIGMSGIAEVLHNLGYKVTGSDAGENQNTQRLTGLGIHITVGHNADTVNDCLVIVVSSAIKQNNPEIVRARERRIPVIQRAEMLAELMRLKKSVAIAGTHGKTTTTSLMACLFETAGLDPTIVNGGILNAYNTNAHLGTGDWIVVEADESDGSFTKLLPTISVVTNIDPEHMEHYKTVENLEAAFIKFIHNMPFYGVGVLCSDHPVVAGLLTKITERRLVSYGLEEGAMVRAVNIRPNASGVTFDIDLAPDLALHFQSAQSNVLGFPRRIRDVTLPMMGLHNVQNSLSLVVVAQELGISDDVIRQSFANFKGVKRRFTTVGVSGGVTVIDDYAHHPVEIKTVVKAAKQACPNGKTIFVVQPHRYSRLNDLFNDFAHAFDGCDHVIIAPVYSAGEEPIEGINSATLAKAMRAAGVSHVYDLAEQRELPLLIRRIAHAGDMVVCMGAGTITYWAAALPGQLDSLWDDELSVKNGNSVHA
ncbi:MAG: UDP-N-acetylmuramate--L-alanine ligase [Pseudomonadota bacterium]